MQTAPIGLIESILTLRGYAGNKRDYDAACQRNDTDAAGDPRFALVMEHEFAIHRDLAAAAKARKRQE